MPAQARAAPQGGLRAVRHDPTPHRPACAYGGAAARPSTFPIGPPHAPDAPGERRPLGPVEVDLGDLLDAALPTTAGTPITCECPHSPPMCI